LKRIDSTIKWTERAESMEKHSISKTEFTNHLQAVSSAIDNGYLENQATQLAHLKGVIPEQKNESNPLLLATYHIIAESEAHNKGHQVTQLDTKILHISYQVTAALEWKYAVDTSLLWNELIWNLVELTGNEWNTQQFEVIMHLFHLLVEKLVTQKGLPAGKKELINECLIVHITRCFPNK
jgi:hypothetical protein